MTRPHREAMISFVITQIGHAAATTGVGNHLDYRFQPQNRCPETGTAGFGDSVPIATIERF